MTFNPVDNTMIIPIGDYVALIGTLLFVLFFMVIFCMEAIRKGRLLDRYRIKYSFDKDIELKEIDNPKNLERRENSFKRRTFKN